MFAVVSPQKIELPAGAVVRLPAEWLEYKQLCRQRGDRALPRIKYRSGDVLLMSPLPKHGRDVSLIADIIKVLLDEADKEYDSFTPVTMELPEESGIEPDYCFYIDHWQAVSGKERIDWANNPPPDLVLEIDVTSFTDVNDYLPYQVPEIWLLRHQTLLIYHLQNGQYVSHSHSQYVPQPDLPTLVSHCLQLAYTRNTSAAIRHLKSQLSHQDS